jgi:aminopeptidase N
VTCDDFAQAMQDSSGVDLTQFRRWYSQAGTPVVNARGRYDARTRTYTLDLEQHTAPTPGQPRKLPFHIPLSVGLLGPDGADLPLRLDGEAAAGPATRVLGMTQATQSFRFVDVPARPVPSLLRGFSAPVKLEFDYSDEELAFLAAHDSDPVNRWDAAQRSFAHAILRLARMARAGQPLAAPLDVSAQVERLLRDEASDPALIALALTLPDPAYVAALEPVLDVDGVSAAWSHLQRELAQRHRAAFERVEAARRPAGPYAPEPSQIGARSLANACLRYLGALDDAAARRRAIQRYDRAGNMTDGIAALAAVKDSNAADRDDLFARFEARWRDEPLVLDKWFALQARSQRDDALARVKALLAHPRFNARNPNRVRSLVGAFALGNFTRFHARNGGGYAFAADQIVALDPANPQLAAALAGAFNLWKRFPEPRRSAMERALTGIARTPGLSPDVREVVSRTLED